MMKMRIVDRLNEVYYDFEEFCYVEGDLQFLVKVKVKFDLFVCGGE